MIASGTTLGRGGLVAGDPVHGHHLHPCGEVGGLGGQPVG